MLLVIDPALSYATFISETGGVALNDIAVDTAGNAYLVGGAQLSNLGGGSSDSGFSIALDAVGDAYVTGLTDNGYGRGQLPRGSQWQWCCFRRGQTD